MRVLFVDPDIHKLTVIRTSLEDHGHTVRAASSYKEALAMIHELCPDAIFTNIALVTSSGFDLARELRNTDECAEAVICALTGHPEMMSRTSWTMAGFDRVIHRPANLDEVLKVLQDVCTKRQLNRNA